MEFDMYKYTDNFKELLKEKEGLLNSNPSTLGAMLKKDWVVSQLVLEGARAVICDSSRTLAYILRKTLPSYKQRGEN